MKRIEKKAPKGKVRLVMIVKIDEEEVGGMVLGDFNSFETAKEMAKDLAKTIKNGEEYLIVSDTGKVLWRYE